MNASQEEDMCFVTIAKQNTRIQYNNYVFD